MQNRWRWLMAALLVAGCEQDGNVGSNADLGPTDSSPALERPADLGQDAAVTAVDASKPANGWVVTLGGAAGQDTIWKVADDGSGNLVALATFIGDVTLEGEKGDIKLSSPVKRTVIAKLDTATRKWVWAVELDGSPPTNGSRDGLAVDAAGDIYYAGKFTGSATFGSTTLTSAGDLDLFVAKLGPDGKVKWAVQAGGPGEDDADAVAVGNDGKLTVVGVFSATASFGGHSLVASGKNDLFVARLDANNGAFDWAFGAGSDTTDLFYEYAQTVVLDDAGNSFVAGGVGGGAAFGASVVSGDAGQPTAYVAKLDPAGEVVWVEGLPARQVRSLARGVSGQIYAGAVFKISALPSPGFVEYNNVLLVTRGESGGQWDAGYNWRRYAICEGVLDNFDIVVDSKGYSAVGGWFKGNVQLGSTTLSTGKTGARGFVAWLDPLGNFTGRAVVIDGHPSIIWNLERDSSGGLYTAGGFTGITIFGSTKVTSKGVTEDGFIWYIPGLE